MLLPTVTAISRDAIRQRWDRKDFVKQDHRRVTQRIRPMLGFKRFDHAAVTISGIELAEKIPESRII